MVMIYYRPRKGIVQVTEPLDFTTIGGRLRAAREALDLSSKGLSDVLADYGIEHKSDATVNRYENNERPAPFEYMKLMAELSGYSLDWIVLGRGDRGTATDLVRRLRKELDQAEAEYVTDQPTFAVRSEPDETPATAHSVEAVERARKEQPKAPPEAASSGRKGPQT